MAITCKATEVLARHYQASGLAQGLALANALRNIDHRLCAFVQLERGDLPAACERNKKGVKPYSDESQKELWDYMGCGMMAETAKMGIVN